MAEQPAQPLILASVVGQIGNTLGASGMASLIKAVLELEHAVVPPAVGLRSPLPAIVCAPTHIRAAIQQFPLPSASTGRLLAGVISSAKMLAYHVLLERHER